MEIFPSVAESELNLQDIAREAASSVSVSPKANANSKINLLIDTLNLSMKSNQMNASSTAESSSPITNNTNAEDFHNGSALSAAETLLKIKQYKPVTHAINENNTTSPNSVSSNDNDDDDEEETTLANINNISKNKYDFEQQETKSNISYEYNSEKNDEDQDQDELDEYDQVTSKILRDRDLSRSRSRSQSPVSPTLQRQLRRQPNNDESMDEEEQQVLKELQNNESDNGKLFR